MASSEIQQPAKAQVPVKDLRTDPVSKVADGSTRDGSTSDAVSCISSADAKSSTKEIEVDQETLISNQAFYYPVANGVYGYYYPGFDGSFGGSDAQSYYVGADGFEIHNSANLGDNGSVIYYFPGFQPDYTAYNQYFPGSIINVDGQSVGQQLYYTSSMYSQPFVSPDFFPHSVSYGLELVPAYSWDSSTYSAGGPYANGYSNPTISAPKPYFTSQSHIHAPSRISPPLKSYASKKGSSPPLDLSTDSVTEKQPAKSINEAAPILSKGFHTLNKLPCPNQVKSGLLYSNNTAGRKEIGRFWLTTEKPKARNRVQGSGDFYTLNEQNSGQRTNDVKYTGNLEADSVGTPGDEENKNCASVPLVRKDEYNLPDLATKYEHALFFVIKSYSEDDIHKSIKYNVWASTPNGNKRLDNAFQVAQEKMAETGSKCPVFLFFSVNASGQFCGVAEMIGRVDFTKSMDFWQQDKWTGFFSVKWHIIKDVPNPQFRHIILANNENKPVTNSRDAQEVKFCQGIEVLIIFKNYSFKTSILDDFNFYENRQKAMQDKRIKQSTPYLGRLSPKIQSEMKATKAGAGLQSLELAADDAKEPLPAGDAME